MYLFRFSLNRYWEVWYRNEQHACNASWRYPTLNQMTVFVCQFLFNLDFCSIPSRIRCIIYRQLYRRCWLRSRDRMNLHLPASKCRILLELIWIFREIRVIWSDGIWRLCFNRIFSFCRLRRSCRCLCLVNDETSSKKEK